MKKRRLPIPLILLIPIVMLVIVSIAGVYRFSLSDEEIMAKFPSQQKRMDPVVKLVFGIDSPNPWTIEVPETKAFSFIDQYDAETKLASGRYDSGAERGRVIVDTQWLKQLSDNDYASVMAVSNQGSGVFYYLARFYFDPAVKRMVVKQAEFLGDRVAISGVELSESTLKVTLLIHGENQAMSDKPNKEETRTFTIGRASTLHQAE